MAIILAIGLATALNCVTFAVLYDAIMSEGPGLSENATQVMVTGFGGIIGVLGGYLGARATERAINGSRPQGPPDQGTEHAASNPT